MTDGEYFAVREVIFLWYCWNVIVEKRIRINT